MADAMPPPAGEAGAAPVNPFRVIPPLETLTTHARQRGSGLADDLLAAMMRAELAAVRAEIAAGADISRDEILARGAARALALEAPRLRPALNATGVIIHTNLGRAPVSAATAAAMAAAAANPTPLEIDPETNARGGRMAEISALLRALAGAGAALVVNNCAAAVLLTLAALTAGRDVIVSRGEAIEIGGGFRIPEVLQQSGSRLVEVGTTNRTYARDYAAASTAATAAWLKVHPSNFQIAGFTHAPTTEALRSAANERGVLLLEDLGSGALLETSPFGLAPEPTFMSALAAGADLVMASGDKLLGGPQAGIIAGRSDLVRQVAAHPLARAVRADKVALAGIAETLRHYARGEATTQIPVWRMIAASADALQGRATQGVARLQRAGVACDLAPSTATVGGGSISGSTLPDWAIALSPAAGDSVDDLARRLRTGASPQGVFGRIEAGRVLLEMRTVIPEQDDALLEAVVAAWPRRRR